MVQVPFPVPNVVQGNKLAIAASTPAPPFIYCYICTNVSLASINVFASSYIAFSDFRSTNLSYTNVSVVPNPRGINGIPGLLSATDDAIRSTSVSSSVAAS